MIDRTLTSGLKTNQNPLQQTEALCQKKTDSTKLRVAASKSYLSHDLSLSSALQMGFLKQKIPRWEPNIPQMEPKVLQRDKIEGAWECTSRDLPGFWQRCRDIRRYLFCFAKTIPRNRKSRAVQAGGREECPQGKKGLSSC